MAQDPERDENEVRDVDTAPERDVVTLFSSSGIDAEMEVSNIHNLLEANGIPSVVTGNSSLPVLEFQVQVRRDLAEDAQRMIDEACATGPEAADEAEAASEGPEPAA